MLNFSVVGISKYDSIVGQLTSDSLIKQMFTQARLVLQGYVLNSILCPDDVHMVVMENSTKLFQKSFMGWDVTCLVVKWMTIMGLKIHSKNFETSEFAMFGCNAWW